MGDPSTDLPDRSRSRSLFRPANTLLFRGVVLALAVSVVSTAFGIYAYYHSPYWNEVGVARDQPILFSHRHHAGELRIDCRFCHATAETGASAGMPATTTCLNCHGQLFTNTRMLQPLVASAALNEPLAWSRVTTLPDHVYFNHSIHLAQGIACVTCHGAVEQMALTAKARPLDMRWCLDCHRNPRNELPPDHENRPRGGAELSLVSDPAGLGPALTAHAQHLTNCSTCHH